MQLTYIFCCVYDNEQDKQSELLVEWRRLLQGCSSLTSLSLHHLSDDGTASIEPMIITLLAHDRTCAPSLRFVYAQSLMEDKSLFTARTRGASNVMNNAGAAAIFAAPMHGCPWIQL